MRKDGCAWFWFIVLNATFNNISVAVSFLGGGNWSIWKTTDLLQVNDKLFLIMLY